MVEFSHGRAGRERRGGGYLIRNASLVLTMDPNLGDGGILGQLENADVLIVGDQIAAVRANLAAPPSGCTVIDGRGMIVMPGFVDTHDHLWQSLIRGCATDGDRQRLVRPMRISAHAQYQFSESDAYAAVRLSTTGLIEHRRDDGGRLVARVQSRTSCAATFAPSTIPGSGTRSPWAATAADGSDIKAAKAEFIDPNPLATLQVAARASRPEPSDWSATAVAKELGVKLHVHVLENPDAEQADDPFESARGGRRVRARPGPPRCPRHPPDARRDRETRRARRRGVPPAAQQHAARVRHHALSGDAGRRDPHRPRPRRRHQRHRRRVQQHARRHRTAARPGADAHKSPTVEQVLRAATMGGAEVLDMQSKIGSLTPGKQADVIVIDTRALNFAPVLRPVAQLVFNGQPQNVKWVFVAGRALKEDGKVKGVNDGAR